MKLARDFGYAFLLTITISGLCFAVDPVARKLAALTDGSVLFGGSGEISQDPTKFFWDGTNHRLGIGTAVPDSPLEISGNSAALPAPISGNLVHFGGVDGAGLTVTMDAFGGQSLFEFRRADTSAASPSAVQSGEIIGHIAAIGYGATGYSAGANAFIRVLASENWTDTAKGDRITFGTTAIGTASVIERLVIDNAGHLIAEGTAPGLSSCGSDPTIVGTDVSGTVTGGSGNTGCVLTFAIAYASAPHCSIAPRAGVALAFATSTTALTILSASTGGIDYICIQ